MFFAGIFQQVSACSCVANVSTCQRFGWSSAVFVGKVIEVKKEKVKIAGSGGDKQYWRENESTVFEVKETFSGAKTRQISVINAEGTSCDVSFQKGATYLIFAGGDEKKGFTTSLCAGNLPVEAAENVLTELRNLPPSGAGGKLYGQISESFKKRTDESQFVGMSNIKIKIRQIGNARKIYDVVTDAGGNYALNVPPGKYSVVPQSLPVYASRGMFSADPVEIKDRSCAEKSFSLENDSIVSGRIVDARGKPVKEIAVDFISTDVREKPNLGGDNGGYTDKNGVFTFYNVPAGSYTLSVNYVLTPDEDAPFPTVFYPKAKDRADAQIIKVGLGQKIRGLVFRLPPRLAAKNVFGKVGWSDGTPVADAEVYLADSENPSFCVDGCEHKTDAAGNFVLKGYGIRKYRIKASIKKEINGETVEYAAESPEFSTGEKLPRFELKLERKKADE